MKDEAEDKKLGGHEMGISRAGKAESKKEKAVIVLTSQTWRQIYLFFLTIQLLMKKKSWELREEECGVELKWNG